MSNRVWVAPAFYGEGPVDYGFFSELLPRLIRQVAHERFGPDFEILAQIAELDDRTRRGEEPSRTRRDRIVVAVEAYPECNLVVIHADANGDPGRARAERVTPALEELGRRHPELAAVACVPERETEAWILADAAAFAQVLRRDVRVEIPRNPDSLGDPKAALDAVFAAANVRRKSRKDFLSRLAGSINLDALCRLWAFQRFRDDLAVALDKLAAYQRGAR